MKMIVGSNLFTALRALLTTLPVLILFAALFLFCAGVSHQLHDDAGAMGRMVWACAHVPKVIALRWEGNTAFRVEFFKY